MIITRIIFRYCVIFHSFFNKKMLLLSSIIIFNIIIRIFFYETQELTASLSNLTYSKVS